MASARIREIMKTRVVTIGAGDRLSTVEDIMTLGGVRHMPVVSQGQLVGVVSERDLLRASISNVEVTEDDDRRVFLHGIEIEAVMSKPAVVVTPSASLTEAAELMADHKIGCLPVVGAAGELVGIVTETDLLHALVALTRRDAALLGE
jgi:CBS domain-containing protein